MSTAMLHLVVGCIVSLLVPLHAKPDERGSVMPGSLRSALPLNRSYGTFDCSGMAIPGCRVAEQPREPSMCAVFSCSELHSLCTLDSWRGGYRVQVSDKYPTPLTPPGWAFSIWGLIFTSQAVMVALWAVHPGSTKHVRSCAMCASERPRN